MSKAPPSVESSEAYPPMQDIYYIQGYLYKKTRDGRWRAAAPADVVWGRSLARGFGARRHSPSALDAQAEAMVRDDGLLPHLLQIEEDDKAPRGAQPAAGRRN